MTQENNKNTEIEVRFLEIDTPKLLKKLNTLKAKDLGEDHLTEIVFSNPEKTWMVESKLVRLRSNGKKHSMAYKHHHKVGIDGATEVEIDISDMQKARELLEYTGLIAVRFQEKKRHAYLYKDVSIDIDSWPNVPTYVELEGDSEAKLQEVAKDLGFDWKDANFENAKIIIEKYHKRSVNDLTYLTFEKIE